MSYEKTIEVSCNDVDLTFNVTAKDYADYINGMTSPDKVAPCFNFLVQTSPAEQKPVIKELFPDPAFAMELAAYVATEYKPKFAITVKKSKR